MTLTQGGTQTRNLANCLPLSNSVSEIEYFTLMQPASWLLWNDAHHSCNGWVAL